MNKFRHYMAPIRIGSLELRNRGVMPAMVTNYCNGNGSVTNRLIAYHEARAKGGVGLIIVEAAYIDWAGKGFPNQIGIDSDALIPGLKRLAEHVHRHGAKIAIQLHHAGRQADLRVTGTDVVGPSAIPCPVIKAMPRELTVDEIKEVVNKYAMAAERAKKAGFDAVELHGTHGYILNQFLSPLSNHRTDEYGGSAEKRMKFPLEVIAAVRKCVGKDYPIIYRIASEEFLPGGLMLKDAVAFSKILVEHGVDALHISGGTYASDRSSSGSDDILGVYVENASEIKEAINNAIPVLVANRIKTPKFAEEIIESGKADLISAGRAVLCDADYYNKIGEGREDEIRTCLSCNHCTGELVSGFPVSCLYNPMLGKELDYDLGVRAREKKKVLVVGGGPGGMETAYIAASRGHRVTLFEQNDYLGGNLIPATKPPFKSEMMAAVEFLSHMLEKYHVQVKLRTKAGIDELKSEDPDVVIVASGSTPILPKIPGVEKDFVFTAEDVLMNRKIVGQKVLVIGGGSVGVETAELLASQNKEVSVVEMADEIFADLSPVLKAGMMGLVAQSKIQIMTGEKVLEIRDHAVVTNKQTLVNIDSVILAMGYRPNNELAQQLQEANINCQVIGDAVKPRKIVQAVTEGFEAAYNL
ncbi:NADH:flavin oxidoreductase [Desulfosporosinus orientis DSM 765]|uniref:NADH:flavin oxidoreductase n=1 Tax=Desulfosporosinus orientis (strain ATCC 19365 / DSM 765 / NCIMB 8382 / VKM B-1628 / Singapore I) TaxID=768706 RepID=G7WF90_DESOD|nr:FAD-dependent oxidoreductase [Desulfosporosinus orientis]AET67976.1 NADH:flavin oxidoreductase [Desulfosporosinus orientis DSM 765]